MSAARSSLRRLAASASSRSSSDSASSCSLCRASLQRASAAPAASCASSAALFSSSARAEAKPRRMEQRDDPLSLDSMPKFEYDDVPKSGHEILQVHRELLKYARVTEWEMPKLKELAKPYTPPPATSFLRFRFQHYQGEPHPVARKVTLDVSVPALFQSGALSSEKARRKFLLLAGERWDPSKELRIRKGAQVDAEGAANELTRPSVSRASASPFYDPLPAGEAHVLQHGQGSLKISCELFPTERQNMKWCSDTLDKMIESANKEPFYEELPLDTRAAQMAEHKRKGFARRAAPSIKDFPAEWLPARANSAQQEQQGKVQAQETARLDEGQEQRHQE